MAAMTKKEAIAFVIASIHRQMFDAYLRGDFFKIIVQFGMIKTLKSLDQ